MVVLPTERGWSILKPFIRHVDETQRLRAGRPREMGPEYVTKEEDAGGNLHQVDGKGAEGEVVCMSGWSYSLLWQF